MKKNVLLLTATLVILLLVNSCKKDNPSINNEPSLNNMANGVASGTNNNATVGYLTIWCSNPYTNNVYVDGVFKKQFNYYYSTSPGCGATSSNYAITLTETPGQHQITWQHGSPQTNFTSYVNITAGQCTSFEDY